MVLILQVSTQHHLFGVQQTQVSEEKLLVFKYLINNEKSETITGINKTGISNVNIFNNKMSHSSIIQNI